MKKLFYYPLCLITLCIFLCSCSVQQSCDAYVFCDRLNEKLGNEYVVPSSYYKVENENEFNYTATLMGGRFVLITINADDSLTVKSAEITVVKSGNDLTEAEKAELYNYAVATMSVLYCQDEKDCTDALAGNGITAQQLVFADNEIIITEKKQKTSLFTNTEIISFSVCKTQ